MQENAKTKEIRYIDLFGGVGGFRLGIEKTNTKIQGSKEWDSSNSDGKEGSHPFSNTTFRCIFYCDNDKYAVQTYNKNFKENWKPKDIRKVWSEDIPEFEMLCGGFPCQAFSIAGKRKGFEETRGTLFFEICRIIKSHRPRIIFLENVKGLLSHDRGRTFAIILSSLDELGYDVEWQVLNSKFFGVPQNRERVFIIGHLRRESSPKIFPIQETNIEPKQYNECNKRITIYFDDSIPKATTRRGRVMDISGATMAVPRGGIMQLNKPEHSNERVYSDKGISPTLNSMQGGQRQPFVSEKLNIRRLTPIECERLQGFPDNWTEGVSDTQRYKQMGNAVTVNVIQVIAEKLIESILYSPKEEEK